MGRNLASLVPVSVMGAADGSCGEAASRSLMMGAAEAYASALRHTTLSMAKL